MPSGQFYHKQMGVLLGNLTFECSYNVVNEHIASDKIAELKESRHEATYRWYE